MHINRHQFHALFQVKMMPINVHTYLRRLRVKRGDREESIFAWPNGRSEKLEITISGRGPGSAGKEKEIYK